MLKQTCLWATVVFSLFFISAFSAVKARQAGDIHPDKNQSSVCRLVVKMISANNYKKVLVNDSLSSLVFDRYLKSLDENHSYLLAGDAGNFEHYRTLLDDDLQSGNLDHVFEMFNTFKMRNEERISYALALLNTDFDFKKKENYMPDRRKMPFIKNEADMNTLWKQRVKYDLLELQLVNQDIARNTEILRKKYQNLLAQSGKTSAQDVFQLFMNAFTASVDPHLSYFNPFNAAQFNVGITRALEGIGATLALENEYVTIKTLTPGGPAYKTRSINPNDRIIAIAQGNDGQFQDITGWRLDNAIALIRGPKGTTVKLKILPKGKNVSDGPQTVEVVRDKIILQDQSAKQQIRTYKANGQDVKVGIITIPAFYFDHAAYEAGDEKYKSTTRDVKLLLDTLKQKKVDGIMIDLRGNGGGSLTEAVSLTGLFIAKGPVVQVRDINQKIQVNEDFDPSIYYSGPLAVLVDRTSASASEIFSGAIQDYGRGLILGSQTYGKGSVQTTVDLNKVAMKLARQGEANADTGKQDQFGQLNVTIGKFYRINGSSTQHKGVMPDIALPSYITPARYGEDNERSAMPWDTIGKSDYSKIGSLNKVVPVLTSLYQQRSQADPAYKAYYNVVKAYQDNETPISIPLSVKELKRKRDTQAAAALDRENRLRVAIGLPVLKEGEARPRTDDLDFMKTEAGQILTDYILSGKSSAGI
jgi:carboxyl-terminal processing protease